MNFEDYINQKLIQYNQKKIQKFDFIYFSLVAFIFNDSNIIEFKYIL